jgi:hypothetical protein
LIDKDGTELILRKRTNHICNWRYKKKFKKSTEKNLKMISMDSEGIDSAVDAHFITAQLYILY